jgi:hypothetical protein
MKAVKITAGLIAVYLVAAHATDWGKLLLAGGKAGGGVIRDLQGR